MTDDEVPPALLAKHPELATIGEPLRQLGRGESLTAKCATCGRILDARTVAATGAIVIRCPDGHVSFRARTRPRR